MKIFHWISFIEKLKKQLKWHFIILHNSNGFLYRDFILGKISFTWSQGINNKIWEWTRKNSTKKKIFILGKIYIFFLSLGKYCLVWLYWCCKTARQVNCSSNSQTCLAKPSFKDQEIFKSLNILFSLFYKYAGFYSKE